MEAFLRGMTLRQRILLVVSAVLVAGVIALFVRLTATADFKTLYAGLSPQDAQAVAQSLSVKNIPYQLSSDGTSVSVPADQLDKTRLALAAEGMPQTGRLGFELFDKPNWAGSDFSEQVNYQRALEGELERTIQTLGSVQSVRVHLVLPHDSLFSDRERVAKAAVVLKLRGGGLTDDEVSAVTHLVASAVDNLSPENVTLIGADGRTPLVAKGRHGRTGGDGSVEMEAAMAEKLVATLAPVVGTDHVKASVTVAWDPSSADTTQELYDPNNPVLVSSQVQEERFGGAPPAGIPGTPSNVPAPPATTTAGSTATAAPAAAGTAATANAAATNQAPAANANPPKPGAPNAANTAAASANTKPGTEQLNPSNPMVSITPESVGQRSESRAYAVSKTLRHTVDPAGRVQKIAAAAPASRPELGRAPLFSLVDLTGQKLDLADCKGK
ncbi:MAG: flagellar M-ring protein FliF, partial [Acidobacteriia bacterium]|nr:flagellar M-ring protein FliF [Terriglobia bacterium]